MGAVLGVISASFLEGAAEVIAFVSIAIFCIGWNLRKVGALTKLLFCGSSLILVLAIHFIDQSRGKDLRLAETRNGQLKLAQEKKTEQEAFSMLSPTQHLERARTTLKVGGDESVIKQANEDLDVLKGTPLAAEARRVQANFAASLAAAQREAIVAENNAAKAQQAQEAAINRILRDEMAKTVENSMLDAGYDVDVIADGPDHTTLHFKWIFVNKVFAHDLSKNVDVFENARKVGFKRIVATDGYDETWTWSL